MSHYNIDNSDFYFRQTLDADTWGRRYTSGVVSKLEMYRILFKRTYFKLNFHMHGPLRKTIGSKTARRLLKIWLWKEIYSRQVEGGGWNWLFNVILNDISVIYVTAHRCAGGLKKKLDLRSGSQRHRHFVWFFNVPVLAPTRDHPFYTLIPTHRPI